MISITGQECGSYGVDWHDWMADRMVRFAYDFLLM
jgi:hypothetical protein